MAPRPASRARLKLVISLALIPFLLGCTAAQNTTKTKPSDFFWQLADLEAHVPSGNPYLGGQNFTFCCLKAVAQSLDVHDGQLVLLKDWIGANVSSLVEANNRGQFPCGAAYNGDPEGAPIVQVDYGWLISECPGWERSSQANLNTWLQPLSGFLLPAVIFCLSVPRRRKIHVYRWLFVAELYGYRGLVPSIIGAICAMILVTLDTIAWLCICFAFAGPMILSGLYEALLDNRMLEFLRVKIQNRRLTLDMRCRLLMIVLIGNLDLTVDEPLEESERALSANFTALPPRSMTHASEQGIEGVVLDHGSIHLDPLGQTPTILAGGLMLQQTGSNQHAQPARPASTESAPRGEVMEPNPLLESLTLTSLQPPTYLARGDDLGYHRAVRMGTDHLRASPWRHMEELLYGIRLYDDDNGLRNLFPRQWPQTIDGRKQEPRVVTEKIKRQIRKTKTRLRTMLHCQYSFGTIVGAPVLFFLGGFIFALFQSLQSLGDEDTAIGIAFGQWYMTVPHIAIVSGLLLAGNNPNILEGIFATERDEQGDDITILGIHFELAYPSCYKVAWQWARGHNKKQWINKVLDTYGPRRQFPGDIDRDRDMEELRAMTALTPLDWLLLSSLATLLLGVPFILAFVTGFFTPEVGVSCRCITVIAYAAVGFAQVGLWLWAYAGPPPRSSSDQGGPSWLDFFQRGGWLDKHGFYNPSSTSWFLGAHNTPTNLSSIWKNLKADPIRAFWCLTYYFYAVVFGLIAIFAALGGTVMQLSGVYHAGLCYVTISHWFEDYKIRPRPIISTNSKEMIANAATYWQPTAFTAIVFMSVVSFIGWWYQKRMRGVFTELVKKIYLPDSESDNEQMLRASTGPAPEAARQSPLPPSLLARSPSLRRAALQ